MVQEIPSGQPTQPSDLERNLASSQGGDAAAAPPPQSDFERVASLPADPPLAGSSFEAIRAHFDQQTAVMLAGVTDLLSKSQATLQTNLFNSIQLVDNRAQQGIRACNTRIDTTVREVDDARNRLGEQEVRLLQLELSTNELRAALNLARHELPAPRVRMDASDFDRQADSAIIVVRSKALLSKPSVVVALTAFLDECNVTKGMYKMEGPVVGRRFSLRFNGIPRLVA